MHRHDHCSAPSVATDLRGSATRGTLVAAFVSSDIRTARPVRAAHPFHYERGLMYHHVKKLMYTVRVDAPDPAFGNMLLEQFGGANGELAAAMQYSIQGLNCDDLERKDLLMDIGTEELSHLEIVGALARLHLKPMKFDRDAAEADPLIAIAGGGGVNAVQFDGQRVDGRLPEDHRRARRRPAQQHRRGGTSEDRLRTADQLHRRCRDERCAAVPDDARDHAHEGVHGSARKPGQAAVLHRQDSADRRSSSISSSTTRPAPATTAKSMLAAHGTRAANGSSSMPRHCRTRAPRVLRRAPRSTTAARAPRPHRPRFRSVLVEGLRDLLHAEGQLVKALAEDGKGGEFGSAAARVRIAPGRNARASRSR